MAKKKGTFRWTAVLGFCVSVGSLLSHPEILALLPENLAVIGSAIGIVIQTLTKQPVRKEHEKYEP